MFWLKSLEFIKLAFNITKVFSVYLETVHKRLFFNGYLKDNVKKSMSDKKLNCLSLGGGKGGKTFM